MKIFNKGVLLLAAGIIFLQSCKKFDSINTNPNSPAVTTPGLLATNLILNITRSSADKNFLYAAMTSKHIVWGEIAQGEQYNSFGAASFDGLQVLTNVQKMIDLAPEVDKKAYTGLGLFIKAYKLYYLSLSVGDIPYSEALQAEKGIVSPKYDTQKDVMIQVLKDLETASNSFNGAKNFSGDPILNGNVDTWRRVVNAFRLKVLISLSKKEADQDLKIKESFAKIAATEPLLRSNNDNLQLVYSDRAGQIYPYNNAVSKFTTYGMISSVLTDTLKKYNDYRLFYYAAPSRYKLESESKAAGDWDAYQGTSPVIDFSDVVKLYNANKYSQYNLRYTGYAAGEPNIRIGYNEQNFILAEAAIRGWIPGNGKAYYEDGITQSMEFIVKATPDDVKYHSGRKMTPAYIADYLKGAAVAFSANPASQLKQVWMQKYLMYFMQYSYDAYYDYRRTGYPNLPIDPATNTNPDDKTKIPVRYLYPSEEYKYNVENLKAALSRQYSGNDKSNGLMWILQ
ncbi:SusD/RagB family nutrient-binding outer membrane lipoprotein [Pedobacter sp. KBW06]|uniref:SusD/RagB family nutrient-binding outer membrane lipoprotein n=1 Tax=Pedobacter sp. KBW06 TaxID=2153359 RepID=UPI000F59A83E|nr:SusD/RagB family nutrient-binding outer membrane lipoprotein [Pedobacter sp. KBW06]RQO72174.1 SusD/RagB family nutrient-binding outer membrane lipoprotein [Pedobacter sp. KBW06]